MMKAAGKHILIGILKSRNDITEGGIVVPVGAKTNNDCPKGIIVDGGVGENVFIGHTMARPGLIAYFKPYSQVTVKEHENMTVVAVEQDDILALEEQ